MKLKIKIRQGCLLSSFVIISATAQWVVASTQIVNLGTLASDSSSYGFNVAKTGVATGGSYSSAGTAHAFRVARQLIDEGSDPLANVHKTLTNLFPSSSVVASTGRGIHQSGDVQSPGPEIHVTGDIVRWLTWPAAFWYLEVPGTSRKYAQMLELPGGTAISGGNAVVGYGTNSATVVGWSYDGFREIATSWSVYRYLSTYTNSAYALGNGFFPNQPSVFTDTDGTKMVGYHHVGAQTNCVQTQCWENGEWVDCEECTVTPAQYAAFIYDGTAYDLSSPSAYDCKAYGMNASGKIVGTYESGGQVRPILWTYSGSGSSSYTLLSFDSDWTNAVARGITSDGIIVGSVYNVPFPQSGNDEYACYWTTNGTWHNLNMIPNSGWTLKRAYKANYGPGSANEPYTIVGVGVTNSATRAFAFSASEGAL